MLRLGNGDSNRARGRAQPEGPSNVATIQLLTRRRLAPQARPCRYETRADRLQKFVASKILDGTARVTSSTASHRANESPAQNVAAVASLNSRTQGTRDSPTGHWPRHHRDARASRANRRGS